MQTKTMKDILADAFLDFDQIVSRKKATGLYVEKGVKSGMRILSEVRTLSKNSHLSPSQRTRVL